MLGAVIGDIAGSRFEWHNCKSKEFDLFAEGCRPTDDTNMTLAVAKAVLLADGDRARLPELAIESMREFGRKYPHGYGGRFREWLQSEDPRPYNSWGNGSAMRVSPCAWAASSLEEALALSDAVTGVTHNHPEGIKGARAVTAAIWMARQGEGKEAIREHIRENYYPLDFTLDEIREDYKFDVSCQGSVPQAIEAFLESESFEDAVRNAVSIGGDSDTIAAMAGSIAEAYYGIPEEIRTHVLTFLDETQLEAVQAFEKKYGAGKEKPKEETEEEIRKQYAEIDRLVRKRIRNALYVFYREPENMKKLYAVVDEVMNAYLYNIVCSTTGTFDGDVFRPDRVYVPERNGYAYSVYTEWMENGDGGKIYFKLSWRDLIRMAAKEKDIVGIRMNPDGNHPVLMITEQNMEAIIRAGDEAIRKHPAELEEQMKKYLVWGPDGTEEEEETREPWILHRLMSGGSGQYSAITPEDIREDKKIVEKRLNDAIEQFEKDTRSDDRYAALCIALLDAYIYNLTAVIPMSFKGAKMFYSICRLNQQRYAYNAYTVSGAGSNHLGDSEIFLPWRNFIRYAVADEEADGIILNPEDNIFPFTPKVHVYGNHLRKIIQDAEAVMEELPDSIRDAVKKGI